MDPLRWARVKDLFHAALARPPDERSAFLRAACEGDDALREEVTSMLAREPAAFAFLESPALEVEAMAIAGELARQQPGPEGSEAPLPPPPSDLPLLNGGSAAPARLGQRPARTRPPWWMILLAAIFLADAVLRAWCWMAGPEELGFACRLEAGRLVVSGVTAGGPAERAGIQAGDTVLRCDGEPYERMARSVLRGAASTPLKTTSLLQPNIEIGRTYRVEIERHGESRMAAVTPARRLGTMLRPRVSAHVLWQIAMLAMLAPALLIAFLRPHDRLARLGALTLAALAISLYLFNLPPGYGTVVRAVPFGLGLLLLVSNLAVALAGPIGLTFFLRFPRPLFRGQWPWILLWLPAVSILPAYLQAMFVVYRPEHPFLGEVRPSIHATALAVFAAYGVAMVAAITANYIHLTDSNDRRRLRVLVAGGAVGTLPGLVRLLLMALAPEWRVTDYLSYGVPDLVIVLGFLLFPVAFAYALLRHRVLGVRVIVRMGLQYALARGVVISLVPLLGLVLVADALLHGSQPLIEIVRERGWIYAVLAAVAALVHWQRWRVSSAIDRRFFREHYDSRRLLRDVAEQARLAGTLESAAPAVVPRIAAALHPAFAALMVRKNAEMVFRTVAVAPPGVTSPVITEDSRLVVELRATQNPVQPSGWYVRSDDGWWAGPAPLELVVPIVASGEHDEALLAFGPKRSEEPYTEEDRDSLVAIAASLALLLERPSAEHDRSTSSFEECPVCGTCYEAGVAGRCTLEEAGLVRVAMPRTLSGRYQLEKRLRRGGMGKVYEATDTALKRRVAVKVIRDEWVYSSSAVERFRREARAVAALDHPNVVTVHDYGVEAGRRAFLVMELLQGVTLGDELRRSGRLGAERTTEVLRGVCGAVEAAHRHRIVHRDLKPENVFLVQPEGGSSGTVKVLDFGVAKPLPGNLDGLEAGATETGVGVLVGTVGYMSPEQLLGERPDVSWDVWALAVVAYECLAGALPFPVTPRDEWRHLVLAGRPTPLREHVPDAPGPWQVFFDRCLSSDRAQRPGSAAAFLGQLETALRATAET